MKDASCTWSRNTDDEFGMYETTCDNAFVINEGTPKDNNFQFCCYCGKPLVMVHYTDEDCEGTTDVLGPVGAPGSTDAKRAAWLADKIVAGGDYAKEAAAMLLRWPAAVSQEKP